MKLHAITLSIILAYVVFYCGIATSTMARQTLPDPAFSLNFCSIHSEVLGLIIALSGSILALTATRFSLPVVMTLSCLSISWMVAPLSMGAVCLHHGPEFDPLVFLTTGYGSMSVLILLTVASWVQLIYQHRKQKKTEQTITALT